MLGAGRVAARTLGRRAFHASTVARMAEEAAVASQVTLTLASPTGAVFNKAKVDLVNIPGMTGEYGVAADHAPVISELKPGVVQVFKTEGGEAQSFFVPGGLSLTHPDSSTDIVASDIATFEELDGSAAQQLYAETKRKVDSLPEGSKEQAVAQIELEVYEAICVALGVSL